MADLPHAALSQEIAARLSGRRLVSAVFLTYQFDPGFFEQEVLPDFFDVKYSPAATARLLALDDLLRNHCGHIAVYYDSQGLVQSDCGSARLDVRRIPIRMQPWVFHPKNIVALVEAKEPDENNHRPRSLLVACLSANLTRSGWWENVEVCHFEEISEGDKTMLHESLPKFLKNLKRRTPTDQDHAALEEILAFMKGTDERKQKSNDGRLYPHFYGGGESVVDFLDRIAGSALRDKNLEIISPFFDDKSESLPLGELIERFSPREVQVFLPRGDKGEALCNPELYESVRQLENVHWAKLTGDLFRKGKAQEAANRYIHAKVLRFFSKHPKREILFVGSANLTNAAYSGNKNVETGFLVDFEPPRKPDFWMVPEERRCTSFASPREDEGQATSGGTKLRLRYHWDTKIAEVYWDDKQISPALRVEAQGEKLFETGALTPREWMTLETKIAERLETVLQGTSLLTVIGESEVPGVLLVQEEGMTHRPSLLLNMSAADILRSWSLLSPEQRAAFLESRAEELNQLGSLGIELVARARAVTTEDSMFDRFAGFFHAFACLEKSIEQAHEDGDERKATYLLFGKKYDSLGTLLQRIIHDEKAHDEAERYVMIACAEQLVDQVKQRRPDFWQAHDTDVQQLQAQLTEAAPIRQRLIAENPREMPAFLDWFDTWFRRKATASTPKGREA